jgi:hypothetical protein
MRGQAQGDGAADAAAGAGDQRNAPFKARMLRH